jgi:simple sugar transport system ATP-binding protein
MALKQVTFSLSNGEILGVAGVDGNGQSELVDAILGLEKVTSGTVSFGGQGSVVSVKQEGYLAHIPDDRIHKGLILPMPVWENILLRRRSDPRLFRWGVLQRRRARELIREDLGKFKVRASALDLPALFLSGGTQQRVLLARELAGSPRLIIAAQPTRGLDISGTQFVRDMLQRYRDQGAGILLISTELEELLQLSDRVAVMFRGSIVGELPAAKSDPIRLGLLMMGGESGWEPEAALK